jgi:hypothetical protein
VLDLCSAAWGGPDRPRVRGRDAGAPAPSWPQWVAPAGRASGWPQWVESVGGVSGWRQRVVDGSRVRDTVLPRSPVASACLASKVQVSVRRRQEYAPARSGPLTHPSSAGAQTSLPISGPSYRMYLFVEVRCWRALPMPDRPCAAPARSGLGARMLPPCRHSGKADAPASRHVSGTKSLRRSL